MVTIVVSQSIWMYTGLKSWDSREIGIFILFIWFSASCGNTSNEDMKVVKILKTLECLKKFITSSEWGSLKSTASRLMIFGYL